MLTTTPAGALASTDHYTPFGFDETGAGAQYRSFTGQKQWTDSTHTGGQYDFMYREYNTEQGRWWTPDPSGLAAVDPGNPQTWNQYAYVAGTPLSAVDPLGLNATCGPAGCTQGGMTINVGATPGAAGLLGLLLGMGQFSRPSKAEMGVCLADRTRGGGGGHLVYADYHAGERPRMEYVRDDCGNDHGSLAGRGGGVIARLPASGDASSLAVWHFKGIACSRHF